MTTEIDRDSIYDLSLTMIGILALMPQLENSDLRILMALARLTHCENEGAVMIRQAELAQKASVHHTTLKVSLNRLHDADIIEIIRMKKATVGSAPCIYRLNMDSIMEAALADDGLSKMMMDDLEPA